MLKHKLSISILLIFLIAGLSQAQIVLDFEDGKLDDWEVIDEAPKNLGDAGPSSWQIRTSQGGLDGNALYQGSNIWGSAADTCLMGTFIIYKGEQFKEFIIDVDVVAADNDGMGLAWAYASTDRHYRAMMVNDGWPEVPVDGVKGPFMKIQKRISDDKPWYDLLEVAKKYTPYPEGPKLHWTLEVSNGSFTFTREDPSGDKVIVSAEDTSYEEGYVGIQLYAQQAEFDNFTIQNTYPVNPAGKVAATWGQLKAVR